MTETPDPPQQQQQQQPANTPPQETNHGPGSDGAWGAGPAGHPQPGAPGAGPYGPAQGYAPPPGAAVPGLAGGYTGDPNAPFGRDPYGRPYSDKSKVIAGVLQLFLGYFGAGRFYTGHTGMALAQLFTCGGLGIWALIDGIMLLAGSDQTDAQGRILRS
jgi:TM2 domain-containing membrane protein YozV